jgi:hypothetical protein
MAFDLGKVVMVDSLDSTQFVATYYGYVGLKETDRIRAAIKLNILCCVFLMLGTPQFALLPRELGEFDFDVASQTFPSTSVPGTERSVGNKNFALSKFDPPRVVEIPFLQAALRITEKILKDPDLVQYMSLLVDSYTRLIGSEFDQGFYSAWILIEGFVNRLWDYTLDRKAISGKRLEGLMQSTEWTLNNKIETLSPLNELTKEEYELFTSLRRRPNEILHPRTRATKEDAERCYQTAKSLVEKIGAPFFIEKNSFVAS